MRAKSRQELGRPATRAHDLEGRGEVFGALGGTSPDQLEVAPPRRWPTQRNRVFSLSSRRSLAARPDRLGPAGTTPTRSCPFALFVGPLRPATASKLPPFRLRQAYGGQAAVRPPSSVVRPPSSALRHPLSAVCSSGLRPPSSALRRPSSSVPPRCRELLASRVHPRLPVCRPAPPQSRFFVWPRKNARERKSQGSARPRHRPEAAPKATTDFPDPNLPALNVPAISQFHPLMKPIRGFAQARISHSGETFCQRRIRPPPGAGRLRRG